jgi:hypothetical protein
MRKACGEKVDATSPQEHKALLASKFTNLQVVQQLLPSLLGQIVEDNSRGMKIEILKNGNTLWQLGSSSQSHLFMLP